MPEPLDEAGVRLVAALVGGVPIALRPYAELASRVGLTEDEVLSRLRAMRDERTLRRLGAAFSPASLGYHAALGALSVPEERVEDVGAMLGALPNVTHVFEIEDRYRLWYTIVMPSRTRLEIAESEIARSAGVSDRYRVLPNEQYKITATFDAEGAPEAPDELGANVVPLRLDRDQKALVRLLHGDLPLAARPFSDLAHTLAECGYDVDEHWVLEETKALVAGGAIRHLGATMRKREEPWRTAVAVWLCPADAAASAALVSAFPEVLHCFERRVPGAGTAILSIVEAENRPALDQTLQRMRSVTGLEAPRVRYPIREFRRGAMRYFTDGEG